MAPTVSLLPLLPCELSLTARSHVNYSHFPLFVDECSKKLTDIKYLALGTLFING